MTGRCAATLVRVLDVLDFAIAAVGIMLLTATCMDGARVMGMSMGVRADNVGHHERNGAHD